ncbi:C4-dicarboxylate TRAP transporter substrate-binding protein [Alteribacillus sp. HJP-4]|uniref:C4-dicarboxylate TRAP transporter substrate-binding protein n=1 Tax=Alteribacillus sp. HJP-4 TaxID=2775394 RepID=UPI0035CCD365
MNKSFFLMIVGVLALLTGCQEASETVAETSFEADKHVVNIAYGNQPGEPIDLQAEKWKELAEERSDGRLQLNLYPSSQLGDEADMIELAINGNNLIVFTAFDFLMDYVPDLGILSAPYIAENEEELFYLTKTDWFKGLEADLKEEANLEIISSNTLYGDRHIMSNKPVETPEDLEGLRIRVPDNNLYIRSFAAMGASPAPLPLGDLYSSLQQGVIDGAENPLPVLTGSRTHEVTNHLSLTGHMTIISPWVIGSDVLNNLPEDLQEILIESSEEAGDYGIELSKKAEEDTMKELEEQGMNIHEVDQEPFEAEAEKVYESMPTWSDGLYEKVQKLLEERE